MELALGQEELDKIEDILTEDLIKIGVRCVLVIDMAGNMVSNCDNGKCGYDIYSLAALSAANFGAVDAMAKILGEDKFSLLFHEGENESIHSSRVGDGFLLLAIFGKDVSLGFLRLRIKKAAGRLKEVFNR